MELDNITTYDEIIPFIRGNLQNKTDNRTYSWATISKNPERLRVWDKVVELTDFLDEGTPIRDRIYCIEKGVTSRPVCGLDGCYSQTTLRNFNKGFNYYCCPEHRYQSGSPFKGKHHSEESRKKLSQIDKSGKCNGMYGRNHSEESKKKMRAPRPSIQGENHPGYGKKIDKRIIARRQASYRETMREKYGQSTSFSVPNIQKKAKANQFKNRAMGQRSALEDAVGEYLSKHYRVRFEYGDDRYPYHADFYLPEYDLFIELQAMWTHGPEPFNPTNPDHQKKAKHWAEKSKDSDFYRVALTVWTKSDPEKRIVSERNGIELLEVFEYNKWDAVSKIEERIGSLTQGGYLPYFDIQYQPPSYPALQDDVRYFRTVASSYDASTTRGNRVVLSYQPHFYEREKELWASPIVRRRVVSNRLKYTQKEIAKLSSNDILRGFKISGIHYGFSHFSPLWFKAFIEEFGVNRVYDPCGGWGHRLLGAQKLDRYVYNDIDPRSVAGIRQMVQDLGINNTAVYNQLAEDFTPEEDYDAVFTCPPYWDREHYTTENTSTARFPTYNQWLNEWWLGVVNASTSGKSVRYFALVTSPDLVGDMSRIVEHRGWQKVKERPLGPGTKSHFQSERTYRDILIVFWR